MKKRNSLIAFATAALAATMLCGCYVENKTPGDKTIVTPPANDKPDVIVTPPAGGGTTTTTGG